MKKVQLGGLHPLLEGFIMSMAQAPSLLLDREWASLALSALWLRHELFLVSH